MLDFTDVHCCDGGFAIKVPAVLFAKSFDVKYTNGASYEIHTVATSPKNVQPASLKKPNIARMNFSRKYYHSSRG